MSNLKKNLQFSKLTPEISFLFSDTQQWLKRREEK